LSVAKDAAAALTRPLPCAVLELDVGALA